MEDGFKIKKHNICAVDNDTAEKIIQSKNADCALIYLYLLRADESVLAEQICAELNMDPDRFKEAALILQKIGIFHDAEPYSSEKKSPNVINQARRNDPDFCALCSFFEKSAGRIIKKNEISALYDAYERLGLTPSVIMTLITHLSGSERGLSAAKFEREACRWSDLNISTIEQAENYLRESRELSEKIRSVALKLKIIGRRLSPSEEQYIKKWLAAGFDSDVIELAYDKTVLNTGSLRWGYMDKILANWAEKGLLTAERISGEKTESSHTKQGEQDSGGIINEQYINQVKAYLKDKRNSEE